MIGTTLSHYQVTGELSRGGMGVVYRAVDLKLDREVALKVLAPQLLSDPELRRRFVQEARAAAALQHAAIAVVHEIDEAEGMTFIAMELVRGERLADLLAAGALGLERSLELAAEVAEGLAAAHQKGVVHRDLKPANVLVTESGHAKIIDFGLAKLLHPLGVLANQVETPARAQTDPGKLLGTTAYMSPEQARGEDIDARSDIFSFGSVLFEMLGRKPAFSRRSAIETLHAIITEETPRLPDLGAQGARVRGDLVRVVEQCLEKDPEDRYQSIQEAATEIRNIRRRLEAPPSAEEVRLAPAASVRAGPLRVVIVDDEPLARAIVREYLAKHTDVEIVAECANGFEAVKAAAELTPDLLFLDIQMPKLTGFEVLELIDRSIGAVFVTAFDEFALRAFEVNAVDYLLKPFSASRLDEALERARQRLTSKAPLPVAALAAMARPPGGSVERILVRQGTRVQVIPVEKLDYAQAQDDYVCLRAEGKEYLKEQTLAELEERLDPARFVRIHRSYILNLERLSKLELYAKDSRVAILIDGSRLPVSRAGYTRLKKLL